MKSRTAEKNSEQLKQLFGKNPDSLLFSRIADLYRKEGNINLAIELCQKGLEIHPEYTTGRIILGRCYIEKENYDNAIDEFISVCKLDRKNLVAIKMLADVFVKQGETGKAGDLYRILTLLDPFDASFKILASRFDTTGKKELLDILEIQSAADGFSNANSVVESRQQSETFSDNQTVSDQFSSVEDSSGDSSVDQMLSSFAEEEPVSDNNNDFAMSGRDIDDRMNTLFGEEVQPPSLDNGITEEHPLNSDISPLVPEDSSSVQPVSGNDISSRIDELFDASGSNSPEMSAGSSGDNTEKLFLDKNFASELKQLHSEQLSLDNAGISEPDDALPDNISEHQDDSVNGVDDLTDSISEKIIPFSNNRSDNDLLSDEFEETLQFDRSMFSRLNDEPDYEELVSSSPFMSMGKTDELFQEQDDALIDNENEDATGKDQEPSDNSNEHSDVSPLDYMANNVFSDEIDKDLEDIHPNSPAGIATDDTVLHGSDQLHNENLNRDVIDEEEDKSGFISGEQLSDKLDSIFGDNVQSKDEIPEHTPMEQSGFSADDDKSDSLDNNVELSDQENFVIEDSDADSPEFDIPDLLSDLAVEGVDTLGVENGHDSEKKLEDLNDDKITDCDRIKELFQLDDSDSSTADPDLTNNDNELDAGAALSRQAEPPVISDSIEDDVRDVADVDDIPQDLDIFGDLSETLETIRKSDVDKIRAQDHDEISQNEDAEKPEIVETNEFIDEKEAGQNAALVDDNPETDIGAVNISDTGVSLSESVTEVSGEVEQFKIDDPALLVNNGSDNIIIDNDDGVVSDMDVLVVSPEDEQLTGDDVAEKIQDIFDFAKSKKEEHFSIDESSLELVEDSDDSAINEGIPPDVSSIVDSPEDKPIEDAHEIIDPVSDLSDDPEPRSGTTKSDELIVDAEPEETMVLIDDSPETSSGISGSDVEERLDAYFGNDILGDSSMNKLVPEDEESEETLIQDFYTLSGENTATASGNENMDGVDDVEIDHTVDFVEESENTETNEPTESLIKPESDILPEMLDEDAVEQIENKEISSGESGISESLSIEKPVQEVSDRFSAADLFDEKKNIDIPDMMVPSASSEENQLPAATELEIDQRDKPYNIPDHVLTPTLADIYFQQGQFQLALQIYSRLLAKDPDNDRMQGRIHEIQTIMEQNPEELHKNQINQSEKIEKKPRNRAYPKENLPNTDPRPLAGVRISKKKKSARRDHRKKE